jgi:hypothetical protein
MSVVHSPDRLRHELRLEAEPLGEGGQGTVTRVVGPDRLVYKEYLGHVGTPFTPALDELVEFGRSLPDTDRQSLFAQSAWPIARVLHEGAVTGFLMQEVPPEFTGPIGGKQRLVELQYLLYKPNHAWNTLHQPDGPGRVEIAAAAVRLIGFLHSHRFVLGDISFRNLLWSPSRPYRVFLLDCDGVRRHGGEPVLPQAQTPEWDDPHVPGTGLDLDTDRYKIALLVARILSRNAYLRPGQKFEPLEGIDPRIADPVGRLFDRASGPHGTRPTAQEWSQALSGRKWIAVTAPPVRTEQPPPTDLAPLISGGQKRSYRPVSLPGRPAPVPVSAVSLPPEPEPQEAPEPPQDPGDTGEPGLGEQVVASEAFADQKENVVSCRLSDDQIALLIDLLVQAGGKKPVAQLVQPLNQLPDRMPLILGEVCRLLNVDDEPVLVLQDDNKMLTLDILLLKEQFLEVTS